MTRSRTRLGRESKGKFKSKDTVRTRPKEGEISGCTESLATKILLLLGMENGDNIFCGQSNRHRGHQTNADIATLVMNWAKSSDINTLFTATTTTTTVDEGSSHAPLFPNHTNLLHHHHINCQQLSLYAGDGTHLHPDPHLMCLKLGKRHYLEDANNPAPVTDQQMPHGLISIDKRGKPYSGNVIRHGDPSSSVRALAAAPVPRCQVEGCHVELVNAKDYHRRHKVCQMHSKAPKVIVLGLEQRFCQQCSRFHAVSEFDDSKRSCRRRLAGHNERRRKSSHDSVSKNPSKDKFMAGRIPYITSQTGRALSLLSSKTDPWISSSDLSSRSSAALHELIADHRASVLGRQLIPERNHAFEGLNESHPGCNTLFPHHSQMSAEQHNYGYHGTATQITLDLMQAPRSTFGLLSSSGKSN